MGSHEVLSLNIEPEVPPIFGGICVQNGLSFRDWEIIYAKQQDSIQRNVMYFCMYTYIVECFANLRSVTQTVDELEVRIKFRKLKKILCSVKDNIFYTDEQWNQVLDLFCKAQRIYHTLNRFVRRWRIRRSVYKINQDLGLQLIDPTRVQCISIYQDRALYLFTLADLINIIHSALSRCVNFFVDPLHPKNPYTNLPFSTAHLLEIYLAVKQSHFTMPVLFQLFFLSDFNVSRFAYENEAIIRDMHIKDYVKNTNHLHLHVDVKDMLRQLDRPRRLRIDKEFPKDVLVNIMRPYLYLYFVYSFSISQTEKKYKSICLLKYKLKQFIDFNPRFGRKIMILREPNKKRPTYIAGFDAKHLSFHHVNIHTVYGDDGHNDHDEQHEGPEIDHDGSGSDQDSEAVYEDSEHDDDGGGN